MSTRASKRPAKGCARDSRRRKMVLDVDLNDLPPSESRAQEGTSTSHYDAHGGQVNVQDGSSEHSNGRLHSAPIDVEAIDDEVLISSPRRFTEARRNHSRRNQAVTVVLDEDSDIHQMHSEELVTGLNLNSFNNHERNTANGAFIDCELYINLESNLSSKKNKVMVPIIESPQNTTLKEPTFSCAICMGALEEATSTICGHIFCKQCIKAAITAQKKCPTCRRKLTMNNIHRVYLPTAN